MALAKSRQRLYNVWNSMIHRCANPKHASYSHYGARGIQVCEEWQDYETFRLWALSNGYRKGLSIEREEVDGNYEPGNCKWIERDEQMRNLRSHKTQRALDSLIVR